MSSSTNMALERAEHDSNNMIEIRDAYMRYGTNNVVLQGLNMTVKKGTIYGLLGPSGCGKTTILNCITGISTLDAGKILVRCQDRRQMGYMPQETGLMEKFKISELLHYFGKVYGMDHKTVENRAKDLLILANLPLDEFYHLYIGSLSGGQQRRVSLLVTLIHDPDLLILDEPTVGLDPITRFSLWEYFFKETEQRKKTILITTHYIEEARKSHSVGMMRGGVLLTEGPAEKMLVDFGCSSLEDVFLKLSQSQAETPPEITPFPTAKPPQIPTFAGKKSFCNFNRLTAQIKKNFYWVKRNLWTMAYILLLPGMMSFMFCTLHTNNLKGLRIAIIPEMPCTNHTNSLEPRCDANFTASCLFSKLMRDKGYIVSEYPDLQSGTKALKNGQVMGMLYFNRNYTAALIDYSSSSSANLPKEQTLENSQPQVTLDMTEKMKAGEIPTAIMGTLFHIQEDLALRCGYHFSSLGNLVPAEYVYGEHEIDIVHNALPGFIFPLVFFMATTYISSAVVSENTSGVSRRSLVSGMTKLEMDLAHVVIQAVVLSVQNCVLFTMIYISISSPMNGSFLLAFTFILLTEFQGMMYGLLLAYFIKKDSHLTNAGMGTVMTLFLTSGMLSPIEGMVPWLKCIVDYFPLTHAVKAYRSVSIRGWGLANAEVLSALQYNMASVVILVAATVLFSKRNRI